MASKTFSQEANSCQHQDLCFEPSLHAEEAGYRRPSAQQRATAAGKAKNGATDVSDSAFPAPLLLPGDDLSTDPRHPPQSLRSWVREKDHNEVTNTRNVIYVAGQPHTAAEVRFVCDWENPITDRIDDSVNAATPPSHKDVVDYLRAFYHGIQLKSLPAETFSFTSWEDERSKSKRKAKSARPGLIGLATSIEKVGIRTRPGPDEIFHQLNLNDLLDAAISVLPDDAYALIMIVNHDIYQDEDDDFCCGRAYGGSRVAVVSTARYNPILDEEQNIEREHAWPASHCKAYMRKCCAAGSGTTRSSAGNKRRKPNSVMGLDNNSSSPSPLQAAVSTSHDLVSSSAVQQVEPIWLSNLWLSRVCQTASHEVGHCFGIDHCVYYACVMQGTASLAEDVRQPPYLCPVDLAKLLAATGANEKERYEAILAFCEDWPETPMFAALGAWLGRRIGDLGRVESSKQN